MVDKNGNKEWTLMFYFASDNPLAPGVVSQLKALKNAGYHHGANVVAYFDPQTPGTPTHTFDVNAVEKLKDPKNKIGYTGFTANDPFVRNLMLDKLWGTELSRDEATPIRELLIDHLGVQPGGVFEPPMPPPFKNAPVVIPDGAAARGHSKVDDHKDREQDPQESLQAFLDFCAKEYKANHYMLFILGHGLIVGDDVFLYDEHATKHSLKLKDLGKTLRGFKKQIGTAEFELASFHSCSMSSLELAYELENTANYMLAAQGPAFVGSWPYTQLLIRIFNDTDKLTAAAAKEAAAKKEGVAVKGKVTQAILIENMLDSMFKCVLHNSTDFMLAGYSFDLCLCDLRKASQPSTEKIIKDCVTALTQGLEDPALKNCILLAHWKAQSYWQENYTDFYDFCFCLSKYCDDFARATTNPQPFEGLRDQCIEVMKVLARRSKEHPDNAVLRAEFAGPDAQYSHGLSVYFPWAAPAVDKSIANEYQGDKEHPGYRFNDTGWYSFLQRYWGDQPGQGTQREVHKEESDTIQRVVISNKFEDLLEDMASLMFNAGGPLSKAGALDDPEPEKAKPRDPTGDDCTCGSIKNYPHDTRRRRQRLGVAFAKVPPTSTSFFQ